ADGSNRNQAVEPARCTATPQPALRPLDGHDLLLGGFDGDLHAGTTRRTDRGAAEEAAPHWRTRGRMEARSHRDLSRIAHRQRDHALAVSVRQRTEAQDAQITPGYRSA